MKIIFLMIFAVGVESLERRIIGGQRISINQTPHSAAIFYHSTYICSGSLISENFCLTAAHCIEKNSAAKHYKIRAGSEDYSSGGVLVKVKEISTHPGYSKASGHDKDFALLRLQSGTHYPRTVKFARLVDDNDVIKTGEMMLIAGWGTTEYRDISRYLLGAEVPIYNFDECSRAYGTLTSSMLCAGFKDGKVDTCQGDSGGGLMRISDKKLVGVTSFGYGCGEAGYPGVYAKISSARSWIRKIASV